MKKLLSIIAAGILFTACTATEGPQAVKNYVPVVCTIDWSSEAAAPSLQMLVYRKTGTDTLNRTQKHFKIQFIKGDHIAFSIKNGGSLKVTNDRKETIYNNTQAGSLNTELLIN